jgi:hypothetical protein
LVWLVVVQVCLCGAIEWNERIGMWHMNGTNSTKRKKVLTKQKVEGKRLF